MRTVQGPLPRAKPDLDPNIRIVPGYLLREFCDAAGIQMEHVNHIDIAVDGSVVAEILQIRFAGYRVNENGHFYIDSSGDVARLTVVAKVDFDQKERPR
jgi:hypothetical protein